MRTSRSDGGRLWPPTGSNRKTAVPASLPLLPTWRERNSIGSFSGDVALFTDRRAL